MTDSDHKTKQGDHNDGRRNHHGNGLHNTHGTDRLHEQLQENSKVFETEKIAETEAEVKEALKGEFIIGVVNLEKHNPIVKSKNKTGRDIRGSWFTMECGWMHDVKFQGLHASARLLYIDLIDMCTTANRGPLRVRTRSVQDRYGVRRGSVQSLLLSLWKHRLIFLKIPLEEKNREEEIREEKKRRDIYKAPAEPVHPPKYSFPPKEKETIPDLLAIWNENRGALSEATAMSDHRKKSWKARWHDKPDLDYWKQVVIRMSKSAFCRGEVNSWKATIDFLLRPETHIKVMEGTYDGTKAQKTPNKATGNQHLWDMIEKGEL